MIILDQHAIGKIEPVILAAAAAHRVLVDDAQPGRCFARIKNARPRARDGFHKLAGHGGDPAHALQEIQDDALAGKNHPRIVLDHRHRLPRAQAHAVENFRMRRDFVMRSDRPVERGINVQNPRHAADPGQNALLLGNNRRRRPLIRIDASIARRIARRPILEQRVLQNRGNAS